MNKSMNLKIKLIIGFSLLLLVILGLSFIKGGSKSQESTLHKKIETVGTDFYENFYYDQISSNKTDEELVEFLQRFEEMGIKVDLDNLSRYDTDKYPNLIDEFVNKEADIKCDVRNTKAIIYPKEPFGKEDYNIEVDLDCGFEPKED